jgi:hypothetical protein
VLQPYLLLVTPPVWSPATRPQLRFFYESRRRLPSDVRDRLCKILPHCLCRQFAFQRRDLHG